MRTTLDIADDVMSAARTLAEQQGTSIGAALSELARRGLRSSGVRVDDGLPVFDLGATSEPITPEMVREALEE